MISSPIHIIGAGGIGVAVGYALAQKGCDVLMVESDREKCDYGQEHGMVVEGHDPIKLPFCARA